MSDFCENSDESARQYITGAMKEGQRCEFEVHYMECKKCFDEVRLQTAMKEGMEDVAHQELPRPELGMWVVSRLSGEVVSEGEVVLVSGGNIKFWDHEAGVEIYTRIDYCTEYYRDSTKEELLFAYDGFGGMVK